MPLPSLSVTAKYTVSQWLCAGLPWSRISAARSGVNSFARSARYARSSRPSTSGSVTHQAASAKAMRRLSITACRYSAELCWASVNLGILPDFSSSSMMPSAISATIPWPFGGCSQISTPWLASPSVPGVAFETMSWPVNLSEIASTSCVPVSA